MTMKKEIWGFYPPPIGGISIYCKRLVEKMHAKDNDVVMRDFAQSGYETQCVISVKNRLWEFLKLPFVGKKIIHAQFTNFYLLFLLYIFGRKHHIVLTLHNRRIVLLDGWKRKVINRLFSCVKYIIFNDPTYTELLCEKYNINKKKIVLLPTYMAPEEGEMKGLTTEIEDFISKHEYTISSNAHRVINNVFGDLYGIDQLIHLMNRLINEERLDVGMVFCISEIFDNDYFGKCLLRIDELGLSDYFCFIVNSPVNGFEVWSHTDLFIRATMSDMEGVSVKEALQFGTPVVASDVCTRPKEAVLYKTGDADDLFKKVYPLILERKRVVYNPEIRVDEEVLRLYLSLS